MTVVKCPKCSSLNPEAGYPVWVFVVALFLFPIGTIAFAAGKKKIHCANCSNVWKSKDEQKWWSFNHSAHAIAIKIARIILCVGLVVSIFTLGIALPAVPPLVCMTYLFARLIWSLIYESGFKNSASSLPDREQLRNIPDEKASPANQREHDVADYQELLIQADDKKSAIVIENAIRDVLQQPQGTLTRENLKKVKELHLSFEGITDLTMLAELTELEFLELGGNRVSDLTPLSNLTKLKILYLNSNRISNLEPLAYLKELTDLALINNLFTKSTDLSPLLGMKKLERLHINQNPSLSKEEVGKVELALPECKIKHLEGCFGVFLILVGFGSAYVFASSFY